jgi:protein Mpv17
MSVPPIAEATLQAALVNAGSNVLAQGIKAYRAGVCE